jgi:DNA-binding transcriptional LysR family regulator
MDLSELDLKKLRAFQLVAKHGNLRLAAARLNQTVPAISSKIRRLEDDLGIGLFERLPNKLILTQAGTRFLNEVEAIFERAEQALATLSAGHAPTGRLSVSTASDYSWYLAPRISNFLKRNPGVELNLQVYRGSDAIRALVRGELDMSIGVFPKLPKTLEKDVIIETTLALVCTAGHPLLRRQLPKLAEIVRHKLIVLPRHGETRRLIDKTMANNAVRPSSIIEVANCQIASTFVEMGVGVAIAHALCMEHAGAKNVSWVDLGKYFGKVALSVVYRRGAHSPLIRALSKELAA